MDIFPDELRILKIAPYYKDVAQNRADVAVLEKYVSDTLNASVRFHKSRDLRDRECCLNFLNKWGRLNSGYSGNEARLYLVYKCQLLIQAAGVIGVQKMSVCDWHNFEVWLYEVYIPACESISRRWNNQGIWGLCGLYMAQSLIGEDTVQTLKKIKAHVRRASWCIPFVSRPGELWQENMRNNSGIEYTNFYLNPVMMVYRMCGDKELGDLIVPLIERFYNTCLRPDTWPYRAWPGAFRKVQNFLFPSADEMIMPTPDNWAGNLLYVAGKTFGRNEWCDYASPVLSNNVCMFRYYKELNE